MKINFKDKEIEINKVKKCSLFNMFRGLMFRRRDNAPIFLLFDFKKPVRMKIHSMFVFFPFVAIWLDDKNKVIDLKIVKSFDFSVSPSKSFCKLIEIPINKRYEKIIELLVGD